jgi:lantibiotic biosynthesis protein
VNTQSLASGHAGQALLAVEQAAAGAATWAAASTAIRAMAAQPLENGTHAAGLYHGLPAASLVLHAAAQANLRYRAAVASLDHHLIALAHRRLDAAEERLRRGEAVAFGQHDLFYGVTGLTALLLMRAPGQDVTARALTYLVCLTWPRIVDGGPALPGWWVAHDPDPLFSTPGGHLNLGMAHGAAGILAVLAIAARSGLQVPGLNDAIHRLSVELVGWRQERSGLAWWPQWLTMGELQARRTDRVGPSRPSWCYGAPGICRALQLAALVLGDDALRRRAEADLLTNLSACQLAQLTDPGLCHGLAGAYITAVRAADDAATSSIADRLPAIAQQLLRPTALPCSDALLDGATGDGLARLTAATGTPPKSGWDRCLLTF